MGAFYEGCTEQDLDLWIDHDLRVLFEGFQGVGKTSMVTAAFERKFGHYEIINDEKIWIPGQRNVDYLYFSAPTLDPWVDFIGVPHAVKEEINGVNTEYLGLLRPEYMVKYNPKGIFIDEMNRASKKIRNAVMELIQFGSINGYKFKDLRCVWAAINPEDDPNQSFDVEPLDPALRDRFHIQIGLPFQPDEGWFSKQFGKETAKAAITWWSKLEQPLKHKVSPRRLEYAIRAAQKGINLRQMLPKETNPNVLIQMLQVGMPEEKFKKLLETRNTAEMRKFLAKPNMFDAVQRFIVTEEESRVFCLPLLDSERLTVLLSKHHTVKEEILSHPAEYKELIKELARGAQNQKLKDECERLLPIIEQMEKNQETTGEMKVVMEVKGLPEMATKAQIEYLQNNYELLSEKESSSLPSLSSYKNEKGNFIVEPFSGSLLEEEIRSIALYCRVTCTNNYYRNNMIERVASLVRREDLTNNQILSCLQFAEFYAAHSHDKTVCTNTVFALVVNDLIKKYRANNASVDSRKLFEIIPNIYYRYFGNPKINREELPIKSILNNLIIRLKSGSVQPSESVNNLVI